MVQLCPVFLMSNAHDNLPAVYKCAEHLMNTMKSILTDKDAIRIALALSTRDAYSCIVYMFSKQVAELIFASTEAHATLRETQSIQQWWSSLVTCVLSESTHFTVSPEHSCTTDPRWLIKREHLERCIRNTLSIHTVHDLWKSYASQITLSLAMQCKDPQTALRQCLKEIERTDARRLDATFEEHDLQEVDVVYSCRIIDEIASVLCPESYLLQ